MEVRSQGEDWGWLHECSLKGAGVPQLAKGVWEEVWEEVWNYLKGKRPLFWGARGEGIQSPAYTSSRDEREPWLSAQTTETGMKC